MHFLGNARTAVGEWRETRSLLHSEAVHPQQEDERKKNCASLRKGQETKWHGFMLTYMQTIAARLTRENKGESRLHPTILVP